MGRPVHIFVHALFGIIPHSDLLSLIEEHDPREKEVGHRKHTDAVTVLILFRQKPVDAPVLIMIFQEIAQKAAPSDHLLCLKQLVPVIVKHGNRVIIPFRIAHVMMGMAEIKNGTEASVFPDHILHILRLHVIVFSDGQRVRRRKRFLLHLLQKSGTPVHIIDVLKGQAQAVRPIRRKVGIFVVFLQMTDRVQPKASQPQSHPVPDNLIDLLPELWILPVQIRLLFRKQVQIIQSLPAGNLLPCAPPEDGTPVIRRTACLSFPKYIILSIFSVRILQRLPKPLMLIRGMVCHKIHQDPDPPFLRFCNQLLHIVHVSKTGINIHVVRHIISIIRHGRWENRTQPDHICSQRRDLIQMPDHTLQIPDSVSIRILKAFGINLISHRSVPPLFFHILKTP